MTATTVNQILSDHFSFPLLDSINIKPRKKVKTGIKALFLDIDGVLNTPYTIDGSPHGTFGIDSEKAYLVKHILKSTGANLVLSSSWRKYRDLVEYVLYKLDIPLNSKIYLGKTPVSKEGYRGSEILDFVHEHSDILTIAILDDGDDMVPFMNRLVQCRNGFGLTHKLANDAINLLNEDD